MQNNVATMEDDVARVVKSMDVITAKSEGIDVALAPHRAKVDKLIGVRRLLKKFEFIFELPQKLNMYVLVGLCIGKKWRAAEFVVKCSAVKQKEYTNAVKYYLLARQILQRYEHISAFKVTHSSFCFGDDVPAITIWLSGCRQFK